MSHWWQGAIMEVEDYLSETSRQHWDGHFLLINSLHMLTLINLIVLTSFLFLAS